MNMKTKHHPMRFLLAALCALSLLAMTAGTACAESKTPPKEGKDKSLLDKYSEGGPWMHPILLTSIVAVAVGVFCAIKVRKAEIMPPALLAQLKDMISQRQVSEAFRLCRSQNSALAAVMGAAMAKANFDADMYNKPAMEAAAAEALATEETPLGTMVNYLNVCAQIAPMLGLFGTVVGMIEAFDLLAAGKAEPQDLASGIGVAMITTAGGLMVAIPAMSAYFYFRGTLTNAFTDLQKQASLLLDIFTGEKDTAGNRPPTGYTQPVQTMVDPNS